MPKGIPGKCKHSIGSVSTSTYQRRRHLVVRGKASWLNRYVPIEEALKIAGF